MPSAVKKGVPRPRRVPQRTCVSCGAVSGKRGLVRIVRSPEGTVRPDLTGKAPGRGAYLCPYPACWDQAIKRKRLERSLRVTLSPADVQAIAAHAATLAEAAATREAV